MKITICGSIAFYDEMCDIKNKLEAMGHEVDLPPSRVHDDKGNIISVTKYYEIRKSGLPDQWIWDHKKEAMMEHFNKVDWSDAVLILNYEKKGIKGYVGANTLLEMGLALYLGKKIYLFNQIPEIDCKEEILGMKPIVINEDLSKIV